jgi:hypothetical protein
VVQPEPGDRLPQNVREPVRVTHGLEFAAGEDQRRKAAVGGAAHQLDVGGGLAAVPGPGAGLQAQVLRPQPAQLAGGDLVLAAGVRVHHAAVGHQHMGGFRQRPLRHRGGPVEGVLGDARPATPHHPLLALQRAEDVGRRVLLVEHEWPSLACAAPPDYIGATSTATSP